MTELREFPNQITTIERFILDQQRGFPDATGTLTNLLYDLALAAKIIASRTTRAGLVDILGSTGEQNVQGEEVQKLDRFAERTIFRLNDHTGRLAVMASEEEADIIPIPERFKTGKYVLLYDPLDGSSNIDFNVSVGTIFAIYRRKSQEGPGTLEDCLQKGRDLVAAGYIIYGSSTMMVYSTGQGVHGFTLDPSIGEFLLSHPNIRIPARPKYYSVNQGYERYWSEGVRRFTRWLQGENEEGKELSLRYIGSLVADFHRNLLTGGIFYYPADSKDPDKPHGKLRLLYEAAPLAFLAEQAGGYASDGHRPILDIQPQGLHQRTPLFIGNRSLVEKAEYFIRTYDQG
ncbi:class 1 fructose-bisphosphatase [Litorilinea aerophila]|uniref:Fructose-1,6-bisphosphatase class 1 n=1 Tax=Litorilinea aerophila TaxID=1204385 RepID=A0A540VDP9_9CHLR|nr:class 1 fructose-bisphosphatase [Litorilinea aerophila]MCC9077411.1 class 1 fructose-bisphosphatase [Litorilinea aerophila]OUC05961.1 fructose 1,6-bisphosphatase [Litorilinea aerophila]GIV76283.1 MAG: fructose-1,6-bisphosphatase class 1 [Litorilinea sp.]